MGSELAFGQGVELEIAALVPQPGVGVGHLAQAAGRRGRGGSAHGAFNLDLPPRARGGAQVQCRRATRPWRSMSLPARQWRTAWAAACLANALLVVAVEVAGSVLCGSRGVAAADAWRWASRQASRGVPAGHFAVLCRGTWGGGDLQAARAAMAQPAASAASLYGCLGRAWRAGETGEKWHAGGGVRQLEHTMAACGNAVRSLQSERADVTDVGLLVAALNKGVTAWLVV